MFTQAFVDAMRPSLILPISLLFVAVFAAFFVRADEPAKAGESTEHRVAVAYP